MTVILYVEMSVKFMTYRCTPNTDIITWCFKLIKDKILPPSKRSLNKSYQKGGSGNPKENYGQEPLHKQDVKTVRGSSCDDNEQRDTDHHP